MATVENNLKLSLDKKPLRPLRLEWFVKKTAASTKEAADISKGGQCRATDD